MTLNRASMLRYPGINGVLHVADALFLIILKFFAQEITPRITTLKIGRRFIVKFSSSDFYWLTFHAKWTYIIRFVSTVGHRILQYEPLSSSYYLTE